MKESCTVYPVIFMIERFKWRGPHILLSIQLCISTERGNNYKCQFGPPQKSYFPFIFSVLCVNGV